MFSVFYIFPLNENNEKDKPVLSSKEIEFLGLVSQGLSSKQIVNLNSLAMDAGISPNTAKSCLSILEVSFLIYF